MTVLVTGANGFVGSHLVREVAAAGHRVVALLRPGAETHLLPMDGMRCHGDFTSPDDARRILAETKPDAIIHAAAVVSSGRVDLEQSLAINVIATERFARLAIEEGVLRWIQISSMSANPLNKSIYGSTKLEAERRLKQLPVKLSILRPSLVYGPEPRGIFHHMVRLLDRLPVVPVIGGQEPVGVVHGADVGMAAAKALGMARVGGIIYELSGPERWKFIDLLWTIRRRLGRNEWLVPIPLPLARLGAAVGEAFMSRPPLTADNVDGIARARHADLSAAIRDLAWNPRTFAEGFVPPPRR